MQKYKDLINKQKSKIDTLNLNNNNIIDDGVLLENNTYRERKTALLEKINCLKNVVKKSNINMLTSYNSILTNKGDDYNNKNMNTIASENNEGMDNKQNNLNTIILENDFLQINSVN